MLAHFSAPRYLHEFFFFQIIIIYQQEAHGPWPIKNVKFAYWWNLTLREAGSSIQKGQALVNIG